MSTDSEVSSTTKNIGNGDDLVNSSNVTDNDERPSCKFGKQCNRYTFWKKYFNSKLKYCWIRKNPQHRVDMAHPGDKDYIVPDMPEPKENAPDCQFGRKCYRLNPEHFRNFSHPRKSK